MEVSLPLVLALTRAQWVSTLACVECSNCTGGQHDILHTILGAIIRSSQQHGASPSSGSVLWKQITDDGATKKHKVIKKYDVGNVTYITNIITKQEI
jgi:hypothetical protein